MSTPQLLAIMSTSRSGSTLLDRMIATAFGGVSLGEIYQIWERGFDRNDLCGCGEGFRDCDFWRDVVRVAGVDAADEISRIRGLQARVVRNRCIPLHRVPLAAPPSWRRDREDYRTVVSRVYEAVSMVSGSDLLIDSSKRPAHAAMLNGRIGQRPVVLIHLVRDSRAVAFSLAKHKRKSDSNNSEAMMQRMDPVAVARSWNRSNVLAEFVARSGVRNVLLRYEDVVSHPVAAMDSIAEALGLPDPDTRQIEDLHFASAHTVSGNPMRLRTGSVELKVDLEWVEAMSETNRRAVTRRTLLLLRRYGYQP